MNMKKVLAAGIAATLAVTSLAAVTSAADPDSITWDMAYSNGKFTYAPAPSKSVDVKPVEPDFQFQKTADDGVNPVKAVNDFGVTDAKVDIDRDGDTYDDYDAFIPFKITGDMQSLIDAAGSITVTIKGTKFDNGNTKEVTRTATLISGSNIASIGGVAVPAGTNLYILPIYAGLTDINAFDPGEYNSIEEIKIEPAGAKTITAYTDDRGVYNAMKTDSTETLKFVAATATVAAHLAPSGGTVAKAKIELYDATEDYYEVAGLDASNKVVAIAPVGDLAGTLAAPAGKTAINSKPEELFAKFTELFGTGVTINWKCNAKEKFEKYAYLPQTDIVNTDVMTREEVWELSTTRDYKSQVFTGQGGFAYTDTNQSFNADVDAYFYTEREGLGDKPNGFAGFASQVADYFNKSLNGKITFVFAPQTAAAADDTWYNGGIPSTEVGLKKIMEAAKGSDFALFLNYGSTTGSLQADAKVNVFENSVTFDISHLLDALGGQTIGTIQDVYYGLSTGIWYEGYSVNRNGLLVQQVIFEKDIAEVDAETEDEPEEEPEDVNEPEDVDDEPEDIDDEPEDIDDEPEDIDDEPEDVDDEPSPVEDVDDEPEAVVDDEPAPVVVVDEPTNGNTTPVVVAGDDENPGTGVALAVVPMMIAAAAAIVSKKRK